MFGKKPYQMNAIEKHFNESRKSIINRGLVIFVGVVFLREMFEKPESISNFDSEKRLYINVTIICLLNAVYSDKNKFSETKQVKSFTSTFICLGVVLFNLGVYLYLL